MIDGYTRTLGLVGSPVEHTLSPAIHNYLAGRMGENVVYVPFHVGDGLVGDAVKGAFALNIQGLNVTVPYKSQVMDYVKELDPLARQIGAVNTLVRTEAGFKGYNTDMPGLFRAMERDSVKLAGEQVLILGAGGVARAVAVLAASKQVSRLVLLNRTLSRAEAVAEQVNAMGYSVKAEAMKFENYRALLGTGRYLAVQATSVGMFPHDQEAVVEDSDFYDMIHTGYDLVFNPWTTKFMKLTQAHGGRAFNGARMLLYQGIIAYELWTGRQVPEAVADDAYALLPAAMGQQEAQVRRNRETR